MLGSIDRYKQPKDSRLFLCKPDRTTIGELTEAYNKKLSTNYNGIHELSFDLPFVVEKNKKFIRNKHVDEVRGHYLIRYEKGNVKEYFIIQKPSNSLSDGKEVKNVTCFLLPYEINRKIVRSFRGTKQLYNPAGSEGALNETLLRKTDWSVGYIDSDIALKYRTFDVSEQGMIEFISDLSDIFNAVVIWDTINKTINFYKNENLGVNKGLTIEYGKYLKTISEDPDFDNVVTRLYVYGNNGISIAAENPAGMDYVESFDYYLHPFERDQNKNIIKHSNYLTDSLCHALLDYQELIENNIGIFSNLLNEKKPLQTTLTTKSNELFVLQTQLAQIEDGLAVANATQNETAQLIQDKENKLMEIDIKEQEIDVIENELSVVNGEINDFKNLISVENNFTPEQITERNRFINEQVWSNDSQFDVSELYKEAVEQLHRINQPRIHYSIDLVDFLKVVECQRDWNKLNIGDFVTIRYPNFNIDIKAKLIGINHDEDTHSLSVEIANGSDIENGFMTLKELFNKTVSSSKTIDMSKYKWDMSEENNSEIRKIIEGTWDATKRDIQAGVNESVDISRKGIVIKDPNDPMRYVVMQHGLIALTNDGGNSWKHAIRPDGIIGEVIIGKLIMGENLIIGDENGTFTIDGNLLTIKDNEENTRVKLGEYTTGKFGLQLRSKNGNDVVLDEDGILQTWQEGRTDNVDGSNPLTLYIYIPEQTINIKKALLRFKMLNFRAYSTGAASGGGTSTTSGSGGSQSLVTTSESGGSNTVTSGDSGVDVQYAYSQTESSEGHSHLFRDVIGHKHYINLPNHTHNINLYIPSHYHDVYIPSHTHPINYGIYKGTVSSQISIHINGTNKDVELGGKFNIDKSNLDITSYLQVGQWNVIDLYSSQLGRIDATVFIQALMGYE
jgi:phage minor structural protein